MRGIVRQLTLCIYLLFVGSYGYSQTLESEGERIFSSSTIPDSVRMEWWTDAKFGMFIHWGIYSVPAGFYKGEAQTNSAEWIMNKGKIPIAEYEKFADEFNPEDFDPKIFVGLAKEAGMKYMVITSKHHDGFSMFNSKSNPYNVVQATPFKRDILKELAEECQEQGIKFGFYYSQAQDWHHPGGMGNSWDTTLVRVSSDQYLNEKAIPEVEQLLTEYGEIAIFWWDTPRKMAKEVVDKLYHVTTDLQPKIITNDRLGEDYPGDHNTYERRIPRIAPKEKYWEVCMPMSGSWGYRSDDKNFKSKTTLIRNLVDIASKGGNYLLNVSPTANGTLMPEAVERLKTMGEWMNKNSESIYGTQASPCTEPDWGRVTWKIKGDMPTLYLNVFDWKEDGTITVRLKNQVKACFSLANPNLVFKTKTTDEGITIQLSGQAPDAYSSVIVLELSDMPNAFPQSTLQQDAEGVIHLPAHRAQFRNLDGPGAEYNLERDYIGSWDHDKASVYWTLEVDQPGKFIISAGFGSKEQAFLNYTIGDKSEEVKISPNGNFRRFKELELGTFKVKKSGEYVITFKPVEGKWNAVNMSGLKLVPVKK